MRRLGLLVLLALLTAGLPEARAHDIEFTFTVVVIRPDGSYQVDVTADLDALALGVAQGGNSARLAARLASLAPAKLDARLAALRRILTERLALRFDGHPADLGVRPSIRVGRARGSCEPQTRSTEESMPQRIGDDVRRGLRPQPPTRPSGCGGVGPSAALPPPRRCAGASPRRRASQLAPRRSQRGLRQYSDGLLAGC